MITRTRQITAGGILRPNASKHDIDYEGIDMPDLAKIPAARSQDGLSNDDMLRRNSQKYEDIMKQKRDELKRKRGALALNSDLDIDSNYRRQEESAVLPSGVGGGNAGVNFRSRLHENIRQQEKEAKEQGRRE